MNKKSLKIIILTLTLVTILSGCGNNKPQNVVKDVDNSQNELVTLNKEDNRIITEEKYYHSLNRDGTYLFREQYDLDGTYYYTYYRADQKGNILNVYDDKINDMETFNEYGLSLITVLRKSKEPGKSDLVKKQGVIDVNGNWVINPVDEIINFYKFYITFEEQYDDYGFIGYKPKIINNNGKIILELPLIEKIDRSTYASKAYFTDNYKNFVFISDFFYHDNKIITCDGDITELNLDHTNIQRLKESNFHDCISIEITNKILIVGKDGFINTIEISPHMCDIRVISSNMYCYYDNNRKKSILVCNGTKIPFKNTYEVVNPTIPVISIKLDDNCYKLATIKNGELKYISKEYYNIDSFNSFGYAFAREKRANGEGGFYTVLNNKGEEVITGKSQIVDAGHYEYGDITIRVNDDTEVCRLINWVTLQPYDQDELRKTFLENLNRNDA